MGKSLKQNINNLIIIKYTYQELMMMTNNCDICEFLVKQNYKYNYVKTTNLLILIIILLLFICDQL